MPVGGFGLGWAQGLATHLNDERTRQRAAEDAAADTQMKLIMELANKPGADPNLLGPAIEGLMQLQGNKINPKKKAGAAGVFGMNEPPPITDLLKGIQAASQGMGSRPLTGDLYETPAAPIPPAMPMTQMSELMGESRDKQMQESSGYPPLEDNIGVLRQQGSQMMPEGLVGGISGGSTTRTPQNPQQGPQGASDSTISPQGAASTLPPLPLPPEPLKMAPTANRMLSAGRQVQGEMAINPPQITENRKLKSPEKRPFFSDPQSMARMEGEAAGIKAGAITKAQKDALVAVMRESGASEEEIQQAVIEMVGGHKTNYQFDNTPELIQNEKGDVTARYSMNDTSRGVRRFQDVPYAPGTRPYQRDQTEATSKKEFDIYAAEETAAGRKPMLFNDWLTMDANRKRPNTNLTVRNPQGFTGPQQFAAVTKLQGMWNKESKAYSTMINQFNLMQEGMKQARLGNLNSGSQAILVTFQKILDPNSVVRESEYARSPEGLGLLNRIQGMYDRLRLGGAGVPLNELEGFVKTGQAFLNGLKGSLNNTKGQIDQAAALAGIDPSVIYGNETGLPETTKPFDRFQRQ